MGEFISAKKDLDELGATYVITDVQGSKYWYIRSKPLDQYHREDGPTIDRANYQAWYKFGKRHRIDGPAVIMDGDCEWWFEGIEVKIPLIYSEKAALEFFKLRVLELKVQSVLDS